MVNDFVSVRRKDIKKNRRTGLFKQKSDHKGIKQNHF